MVWSIYRGVRLMSRYRYIGVCMSKIEEMFYTDLYRGIAARALEYGCKLLIYNSFSDLYNDDKFSEGEKNIFTRIRYDMLDGLIILGETIKNDEVLNDIVSNARKNNIYVVSIDKHIEGCYNVEYNYRSSFEAIVRHVVEKHNCKTINVVAGFKGNHFSDERVACCKRIMEEHGLELIPERILYGNFWSEPTARAFDEFMKSKYTMPDAFICCNDAMAITVCSKLTEYGFSVPRDVIVTGFDGIYEEQFNIPRLTTACQNTGLAGEKAVDAIIAHLNGRETGNLAVIDHRLVWSHSCGCKPIDYREATGKITDLFHMTDSDNSYDSNMADFSTATTAAVTYGIKEVSETVLRFNNTYGYYYYALSLKEDFMNISDDYEDFIWDSPDNGSKRLILCESVFGKNYEPYYDTGLRHIEEAAESINIFFFWSVHFREETVGYGVMGLSTGNDGHAANDDTRHLLRYTRYLNSVLEIVNSQSVLKKVIAKLQSLYIRDHTGLYNRRGFYKEIGEIIGNELKNNTYPYLAIISADMDGLKYINDTYGHAEGDVAIKAFADALLSVSGEKSICSRFGGDEFIIACVCDTDPAEKGKSIVKDVSARLEEFNSSSGKPFKVIGSFGVYGEKIVHGMDIDSIIKKADDLMYKEKSRHKGSRKRASRT